MICVDTVVAGSVFVERKQMTFAGGSSMSVNISHIQLCEWGCDAGMTFNSLQTA